MTSKPVALLMADLGVTKTHSRPHVSNDNPYSEAQFKTLKYRPDYPGQFADWASAQSWLQAFFFWYNQEHCHTGLALMTPAVVHYGRTAAVSWQRQQVLDVAFGAHPERFRGGRPAVDTLPQEVWINPPAQGLLADPAAEHTTASDALLSFDLEEKSSLILVNELSQCP